MEELFFILKLPIDGSIQTDLMPGINIYKTLDSIIRILKPSTDNKGDGTIQLIILLLYNICNNEIKDQISSVIKTLQDTTPKDDTLMISIISEIDINLKKDTHYYSYLILLLLLFLFLLKKDPNIKYILYLFIHVFNLTYINIINDKLYELIIERFNSIPKRTFTFLFTDFERNREIILYNEKTILTRYPIDTKLGHVFKRFAIKMFDFLVKLLQKSKYDRLQKSEYDRLQTSVMHNPSRAASEPVTHSPSRGAASEPDDNTIALELQRQYDEEYATHRKNQEVNESKSTAAVKTLSKLDANLHKALLFDISKVTPADCNTASKKNEIIRLLHTDKYTGIQMTKSDKDTLNEKLQKFNGYCDCIITTPYDDKCNMHLLYRNKYLKYKKKYIQLKNKLSIP